MIAMECNGKDVYENSCCVLQCILNVKVLRGCDFCVICEVFFFGSFLPETQKEMLYGRFYDICSE